MSVERIGIYAGSFDPPTAGHYHMIKKACSIFDHVEVVIAVHPTKKPMFSVEERLSMLRDMLIDFKGAKVEVLPDNEYLVSYAKRKYKNVCLIRGIRDNLDFSYEQTICRTNKLIEADVETVYLMPEDAYSLVSSSWVKGLIGMNGWRDVIRDFVTPYVLNVLKEKYLWSEIQKIISELFDGDSCSIQGFSWAVGAAMHKGYKANKYHNFDHILDGLEAFKRYYPQASKIMLYAWLLHDVNSSEDESIKIANGLIPQDSNRLLNNDRLEEKAEVKKFIAATKHKTCTFKTEEERIFASIDLLCLGLSFDGYSKYQDNVLNEYLNKSGKTLDEFMPLWAKGRSEFIESMLKRTYIYPDEKIRSLFESSARRNLTDELNCLKEYIAEQERETREEQEQRQKDGFLPIIESTKKGE